MKCTHCKHELKLKYKFVSISDDKIKEYSYQWWKCPKCKHVYFGELTEYISDDSYEHAMYKADLNVWRNDIKALREGTQNINFSAHYTERIDYSYVK